MQRALPTALTPSQRFSDSWAPRWIWPSYDGIIAPVSPPDAPAPAVTKSVPENASTEKSRKPVDAEPDNVATKADAPKRVELPPAIEPNELVDTDTVRLERVPFDRDDVRLVGYLEPMASSKRSGGSGRFRLDGGPFRTRQEPKPSSGCCTCTFRSKLRRAGRHHPHNGNHDIARYMTCGHNIRFVRRGNNVAIVRRGSRPSLSTTTT